jgi:hypothetical protein
MLAAGDGCPHLLVDHVLATIKRIPMDQEEDYFGNVTAPEGPEEGDVW